METVGEAFSHLSKVAKFRTAKDSLLLFTKFLEKKILVN